MRLILEIPDAEADALRDKNQIVDVLREALGVYVEVRQQPGVAGYVEKRYPEQTAAFKNRKIASVTARIRAARAIRRLSGLHLEEMPPAPPDLLAGAVAPIIDAALPRCEHAQGRAPQIAANIASWVRGEWGAGPEPEQLHEHIGSLVLGDELPHCDHAIEAGLDHHELSNVVMDKVREVYPALRDAQLGDASRRAS